MPNDTPEALSIPKLNPRLRNIPQAPYLEVGASGASKEIYNENTEARCSKIWLQNRSTATCLVAWNTAASPDSNHAILVGGSAEDDGLGAIMELDIQERGIKSLSLYSASTLRVSVEKFQFAQQAGLISY